MSKHIYFNNALSTKKIMKIFNIIGFSLLLSACSEGSPSPQKETVKKETEDLVQVKDGVYTEWYPGKKQIKFKGGQDEKHKRHGIWIFYSEDGKELSVTIYEHGVREGFSVVKYPNGAIHYRGEYLHDQTVGIWTMYDEKGKVISETDFGYPKN